MIRRIRTTPPRRRLAVGLTVFLASLVGAFALAAGGAASYTRGDGSASISAVTATLTADPTQISFQLSGCRNDGSIVLPIAGKFVCPDSAYTNGNLGKGWNELDLVPQRVSLTNGDGNQTYIFVVAGDYKNGSGNTGWDVVSELTRNDALSSASCPVSPTMGPTTITPSGGGAGGADQTIYRTVTLTQVAGSTCVYDYYTRLALGSHLFSGSSLQVNLWNQTLGSQGIGQKRNSIPVNEILPQELRKDMSAEQGSAFSWNLTKSANPINFNFENTCANSAAAQSHGVQIVITWTKSAAQGTGDITITTNVYAKNPASRTITVDVSDQIYHGSDEADTSSPIGSPATASADVGPNSELLIVTQTITRPAGDDTAYHDIATGSYTDKVTGVPVPGTTTASAHSDVVLTGEASNDSVTINDTESISGSGLSFSLSAPSVGAFVAPSEADVLLPYVAGASTVGPVNWSYTANASGSVTFNKTVSVAGATVTSGTLADAAQLVGDGQQVLKNANASTGLTSTALVSLTISKSISGPSIGSAQTFLFDVTGPNGYSNQNVPVVIAANGTSNAVTLSNLAAGTYNVSEDQPSFYGPVDGPFSPSIVPNGTAASCSATVTFVNHLGPASAGATKSVSGTGSTAAGWEITLTGPSATQTRTTDSSGNLSSPFSLALVDGGHYVISENASSLAGYDPSAPTAGGGATVSGNTCVFDVHYPADAGKAFSCAFSNIKRGHVTVVKTENGQSPTTQYSFRLSGGPDSISITKTTGTADASPAGSGNLDFGNQKPGNYQLCELLVAAGTTSTLQLLGGVVNTTTGDICLNFTLAAGESKVFNIDNAHPLGGQRTIGYWKNWNGCSGSNGNQVQNALKTGHALVEAFLPLLLGNYNVTTCQRAVSVLSNASSKYAENGLAAQLLGAKLNRAAAGGQACTAANTAMAQADALLIKIAYGGPSSTILQKASADRTAAVNLTSILDQFNNEKIC